MWELDTVWVYPKRMGFRLNLQPDCFNLGDNYYSSGSWREKWRRNRIEEVATIYLGGAWLLEGIGF